MLRRIGLSLLGLILMFLYIGTVKAGNGLQPPLDSALVVGDEYAQAGVDYWQQKWPGHELVVLAKQKLKDTETGLQYTILKGELDGQKPLYLTVRQNDNGIGEGRYQPQLDRSEYLQGLDPVYQKMSRPLRERIRAINGGDLPRDPASAIGQPIDVIFIVQPQADIQKLTARVELSDPGLYMYDGAAVYQRAIREGTTTEIRSDQPLRLIAARLDLAQIAGLLLNESISQAWLDQVSELSLDQSVPHVNGDDVHNLGFEGGLSDVGIIDTGIDSSHPDLDFVIQRSNFTGGTTNDDTNGHGTHVAGIIGSHNSTYTGMAPHADLISAKVLAGGPNSGKTSAIISGVDWAISQGADVIQMSINTYDEGGTTDASSELSRYVDSVVYASSKTFVISAGNYKSPGNTNTKVLVPADAYNSISVGASNETFDAVASYSGQGLTSDGRCKVDVVAPGTAITSAAFNWEGTNPDFVDLSGTSMAAPHVSGLAALLWDSGSQNTISQAPRMIKAAILASATHLAGWGHNERQPLDSTQGSGQIDAQEAIDIYGSESRSMLGSVSGTNASSDQYYLVNITSTAKPLNTTLVWERHVSDYTQSDPPILNDLDLRLYTATLSSQLSYSWSAADNVEQIYFPASTAGYYWIKVDPFDLFTDGSENYALAANFDMTAYGDTPLAQFNKSSPANAAVNRPLATDLSWDSSIGAASYEYCIDKTNDDDCDGDNWIEVGNNTSVHLTGLLPLTTYYWQVQANNPVATRIADGGTWHRFTTTLATVSGVSASDGAFITKVAINWNSVSSATSYKVYRAEAPSGSKSELGTVSGLSYDDTNQTPEHPYYYFLRACNSNGCGDYSANDSGYREMPSPGNVSASDGTYMNKVRLTWSAIPGATYYKVYRGTSAGGQTYLADSSAAFYEDTTTTAGRTYYYYVQGWNSFGNGGQSNQDTGWRKMEVPGNFTASDGTYSDKVRLSWNSIAGATYYEIYRTTTSGGTGSLLSSPTVSPNDDNSATIELHYFYTIRACNSYTCGSRSSENEGWREMAAPTSLSASDGTYTDKVHITWTSVPGASQYNIYRGDSPNNQSYIGQASSTTFDDTGSITARRPYYYDVEACNGNGCGFHSSDDTGYRDLQTPTGLIASDGDHPGFVRVIWTGVPYATYYKIFRGSTPGGQSYLGQVAAAPYDDASALPFSTYYYYAQACNSYGCGPQSTSFDGGLADTGIAQSVTASDGSFSDKVHITWSNVVGATSYWLFRKYPGETAYFVGETGNTYYDDTFASVMSVYDYYVVVNGNGDPSITDSGWRKLAAPGNFQASDNDFPAVRITLQPPADSTIIYLYRAPAALGPWTNIPCSGLTECDDSPAPDTTFFYKAQACVWYEDILCGDFSTVDSGWRRTSTTAANATDGSSSDYVQISWAGIPGADFYMVLASDTPDEPGSWVSVGTYLYGQVSYNHVAPPGILYYYAVQACSTATQSCAEMGHYDPGWRAVPAPGNVQASDGRQPSSIQLTWSSLGFPSWIYYEIYRSDALDGSKVFLDELYGLAYTDTSVVSGTTYYYWIRACSYQERCSDYSLPDTGFISYMIYLPLSQK